MRAAVSRPFRARIARAPEPPRPVRVERNVETIDFEAFYPSVPHAELIKALTALVSEALTRRKATGTNENRTQIGEHVLRIPRAEKGTITLSPLSRPSTAADNTTDARVLTDTGDMYYNKRSFVEMQRHDHLIGMPEFSALLKAVLTHTFFRFGAQLFLQLDGIPMGTHGGPQMANGFGFYYELGYLRTLVRRHGLAVNALRLITANIKNGTETEESTEQDRKDMVKIWKDTADEARALGRFCRFIDDGFSIGNPYFQKLKACYPPCLKITTASSNADGKLVVFMDLNIKQNTTHPFAIVTTLYDKRRGSDYANVPKIYYTHGTTFLANFQIGVNTISGQFHRFRRIITDRDNFVLECAIMLVKMNLCCKIKPQPLFAKLKGLLFRFPYRHGTTTTRPTTAMGNYHSICNLYNAAIKQPAPVDWLIQQSPQIIEERALQSEEPAAARQRTA